MRYLPIAALILMSAPLVPLMAQEAEEEVLLSKTVFSLLGCHIARLKVCSRVNISHRPRSQ